MKLFELFNDVIEEGVNDPNIFKAVFLIGGPGSGKSFIGNKLASAHGLKTIDVDKLYAFLNNKENIDISTINPQQRDKMYNRARTKNRLRRNIFFDGRLGVMIDGTGRRYESVKGLHDKLIDIGYDCMLIYINTDLQTALRRAARRKRNIHPRFVKKAHMDVKNNLGKYQNLFNDIIIIDNSDDDSVPDLLSTHRKLDKFLGTTPSRPEAQQWIQSQRS